MAGVSLPIFYEDLDRIRQYIVNNPASWAEDRFFTEAQ
jgi:hypothetical protein